MTKNFVFETDSAAKKMHIEREFNAPIEKVWKAWTDPEILDKWWSPKPHQAVTKIHDFTVGGTWQFAMVTPEGKKNWLYAEFTAIENGKAFSATAVFCDGEGNPVTSGPKWHREVKFLSLDGNRTKVNIEITYEDEATFKMFADGFFKDGTTMSYNQLDELLASE
ncbi:MAG TPA: SRPBCC domain-containing protein [Mucilaginibacter sp.]|nr:SRPBCC domain-containing protein [Mucilaginibacter sp.]